MAKGRLNADTLCLGDGLAQGQGCWSHPGGLSQDSPRKAGQQALRAQSRGGYWLPLTQGAVLDPNVPFFSVFSCKWVKETKEGGWRTEEEPPPKAGPRYRDRTVRVRPCPGKEAPQQSTTNPENRFLHLQACC
jgi:hypothetical protein